MEVLRKLDVPSVEQVLAVPEISFDRVPQRSVARSPAECRTVGGSADGTWTYTGDYGL